jgi:hypothetical protein
MLNKEFQQKDVQRLRNLVKGKYGEKTTVGIGYTKKHEFHNEGDVWEEENRTWTIKNGIKQNITKLDKAKQIGVLPLLCPSCNKLMRTHIDKPFYNIHNKCMNCVVEFETKLRVEGKWEEYQKQIHNEEIDRLINNFKDWSEDELKATDTFVTEAGDVETWVGGNNTKIVEQNIKESIKFLENLKKQ